MARINKSFYAILGILGFGPISGYKIKSWVDDGVGFFWDVDYKQIYPTLKRFIEDGLATYTEETTGKRRSKLYRLTEKGHQELRNWLGQPIANDKQNASELMLKLFFGHHLSVEKNIEHVRRFREICLQGVKVMEEIKQCLNEEAPKDSSWHYRMMLVTNGDLMRKANLEWCDMTVEYLKEQVKD